MTSVDLTEHTMGWYTQSNTHLSLRIPFKLHFTREVYKCFHSTAQQSEPEKPSAKVKNGLHKRLVVEDQGVLEGRVLRL